MMLVACSGPELIPAGDWPWDAAEVFQHQDAGPPCDPENLMSLQADFGNCGECGVQCSTDDADRCMNGTCLCGNGPVCTPGSDCIAGRCLVSDRFSECTQDIDCPNESGDQSCLSDDVSEIGLCVDVCEFTRECPNGFACVEGACTRQECVSEGCDGIDNDCDGTVDENTDGTGPLSQWCLTGGNPMTPPMPPCRRGTQVCSAGLWSECLDEIAPTPEVGILACNLADDDCDGCVDGTFNEDGVCVTNPPSGFDVLYLIDISGSMGSALAAVREATESFSAIYAGNPEFRFGIVIIAGRESLDNRSYVYLNFADFATFNTVLGGVSATGGANEPTWDAVYEAATGEIPHGVDTTGDGIFDAIEESRLGLSWRENSVRIMVMFADEEAQTSRERRGLGRVNETVMCRALDHGEVLVTFGTRENQLAFDDCGTWYELSTDPGIMLSHLSGIIADPCL